MSFPTLQFSGLPVRLIERQTEKTLADQHLLRQWAIQSHLWEALLLEMLSKSSIKSWLSYLLSFMLGEGGLKASKVVLKEPLAAS